MCKRENSMGLAAPLLHGVWALGDRWWHRNEDGRREVCEEKLKTPVRGTSEPGSELREILGEERLSPVTPREDPRVEEVHELRLQSPGRGSEGAQSPLRALRVRNPEVDSEAWRRSRVIITPWGEKYHLSAQCPTLNLTRKIKFSPWRQACAVMTELQGPIFAVGPGKVAHMRPDCPRIDRLAVGYLRCQVCSQREERLGPTRP